MEKILCTLDHKQTTKYYYYVDDLQKSLLLLIQLKRIFKEYDVPVDLTVVVLKVRETMDSRKQADEFVHRTIIEAKKHGTMKEDDDLP